MKSKWQETTWGGYTMGRPGPPLSALVSGNLGPPFFPDLASNSLNPASLSAIPHSRTGDLQLKGCGEDGSVARERFPPSRKPGGVDSSLSQIDLLGSTFSTKSPPRSAKSISDPKTRGQVSSSQEFMEVSLGQISRQRIPCSEKMKGAADISPVARQLARGLNADSDPSRRRILVSGCAPDHDGHLPTSRCRAVSQRAKDDGWTEVKPKYWWRKIHGNLGKSLQQIDATGARLFKSKLQGKCFNCLSPNHYAFRCSAATRCWLCLHTGHRARLCPRNGYTSKSIASRSYAISVKHSSHSAGIYSSTYWQSAPGTIPLHKGQGTQLGTAPGFSPLTLKKTFRQVVQQGQDMEARYPGRLLVLTALLQQPAQSGVEEMR
jgi:hypothetical protein